MAGPAAPCQPGDIIVRTTSGGFLICRIAKYGPALDWHYIVTVTDFDLALDVARRFAGITNVRAWVEKPDQSYTEIPPSEAL
jgi:hypothetical protein